MYSLANYINRGNLLINNSLRPNKKKLSTIMFYATDRCNSKCKHCYIWEKTPKQHLPLSKIKEVLSSRVVSKHTTVGLEGGEFILHPEAFEILDYLHKHHPNFDLLSNCVMPDKVIEACEKFTTQRLYISLDGDEEKHDYIRGAKDGYKNVIKVIEKLHKKIPISVMFTLTPYNDFKELNYVASICKKYDIDMRIGIYNNMEFFDTKDNALDDNSLNFTIDEIPEVVKDFKENYDFMVLYTYFRKNKLKLTCNSIRDSIVIYPDGTIPICQNKKIPLGNLYEESIDQIINKRETIELHKKHKQHCNACWVNFHRKYDIVLFRNLEKLMPKKLIESFFGEYFWDKTNKTLKYSNILKNGN